MTEKFQRTSFDLYIMDIARIVASRSTCLHRHQGAVIVRDRRIISAGYNGSPPGAIHCVALGYCNKEEFGWCRAEGLHGESNAIASAARMGISVAEATIYCLYSPCRACCNLIISAGITAVKYAELYESFPDVRIYLENLGIEVNECNIS